MRLCSFVPRGGEARLGVVVEGKIHEATPRTTMTRFLESGANGGAIGIGESVRTENVELQAPVPRPGKIVAAIVNTRGMLGGKDLGLKHPRLDMKAPSCVVGPGALVMSAESGVRPEVELAAVIGKRISGGDKTEATESIFGYTVLNDVTAPKDSREDAYEAYRRDRQSGEIRRALLRGPLFRSKNHDTFCPMGPELVTSDEMGDVSDLKMTTRFDGTLVQDGSTAEYIFSPAEIASFVSGFLTLEPGDVVSCGSVGWTREVLKDLDPTEYVLPAGGGVLELEIEGIGVLRNPVSRTG